MWPLSKIPILTHFALPKVDVSSLATVLSRQHLVITIATAY